MRITLFVFRISLIIGSAVFMGYHTQIFISRIEGNTIFSWLAALLIEGMIISLALMRTVISRMLLIPVFLISVVAASASFIVQNEKLLDDFFKNRRIVEQLKSDITGTQSQLSLGEKYTTRTLLRERKLKDELQAVLRGQNGDVTIANSLIFLVLVLVMQGVSVYTAMTLKDGVFQKQVSEFPVTETEGNVSGFVSKRFKETETLKQDVSESETSETDFEKKVIDRDSIIGELAAIKSRTTFDEMSRVFGVSKATLSRILTTRGEGISEEIFSKVSEGMRRNGNGKKNV